jgi:small subunit ribosomal protein S6e
MARFKLVISTSDGKSKGVTLEGPRAQALVGKRIGDLLNGSIMGLSGSKLQITGGSDKTGFPMRFDVHGGVKVSIILSDGVGFKASGDGHRQRKTVRGNVITDEIVQINLKVLKK